MAIIVVNLAKRVTSEGFYMSVPVVRCAYWHAGYGSGVQDAGVYPGYQGVHAGSHSRVVARCIYGGIQACYLGSYGQYSQNSAI